MADLHELGKNLPVKYCLNTFIAQKINIFNIYAAGFNDSDFVDQVPGMKDSSIFEEKRRMQGM